MSRPAALSAAPPAAAAPGFPTPAAPRSLAEQIADGCGQMIVEGRLKAGDRLTEQQLAAEFKVSRGPVREALRILERRRLIEMPPRRGAFVRSVSLERIEDLFNTRTALIALGAATMAERPVESWLATLRRRVAALEAGIETGEPVAFAYALTRTARAMVMGSGNEVVRQVLADLDEQSFWTTIWRAPLDCVTAEVRRERTACMREALEAIERRDPVAAGAAAKRMCDAARDAALGALALHAPAMVTGQAEAAEAETGPMEPDRQEAGREDAAEG